MKRIVYSLLFAMAVGSESMAQEPLAADTAGPAAEVGTGEVAVGEAVTAMDAAGLLSAQTLATEELEMPELTPGPTITLAEALQRAKERNLDLSSARLEIEKTQAGLSKSWGLVLPYVQGTVEYIHMDHADEIDLSDSLGDSLAPLVNSMVGGGLMTPADAMALGGGGPLLANPQDKVTGAIQVMLPLVNPESWCKIRTAQKGVEIAELSIETANRQILLGVSQAYLMVMTTRDLIDFYFSQLRTTQAQLRVSSARFNAGRAMRIDVIRAETEFEQARQSLLSAVLGYDNARDTLGQLIGMDELPQPADAPTMNNPSDNTDALMKQAKADRLDVKVKTATVELRRLQKRAVWMQFFPKLEAAWQGSYQFTEMADMGSDDRTRWALALTLTVPLYNHYRYAELDEKRAALQQAEIDLENSQQKTSLAVRKAQRDYATAMSAVATAEKQKLLAQEGLELTEAAYRNGRGTSLDVTMATQQYTAAGLNLTTSQLKAQLALLTLLDAIGADIPRSIVVQ